MRAVNRMPRSSWYRCSKVSRTIWTVSETGTRNGTLTALLKLRQSGMLACYTCFTFNCFFLQRFCTLSYSHSNAGVSVCFLLITWMSQIIACSLECKDMLSTSDYKPQIWSSWPVWASWASLPMGSLLFVWFHLVNRSIACHCSYRMIRKCQTKSCFVCSRIEYELSMKVCFAVHQRRHAIRGRNIWHMRIARLWVSSHSIVLHFWVILAVKLNSIPQSSQYAFYINTVIHNLLIFHWILLPSLFFLQILSVKFDTM